MTAAEGSVVSSRTGDAHADAIRPTVLYIAGSGRSGSTLVERTIGAIVGFADVGELIDLCRRVAPHDERCGCGRPFGRCPFWKAVGEHAFGGWNPELLSEMHDLQRHVARQRHLPRLLSPRARGESFSTALARYTDLYDALYRAISRAADARVIVDASKWPAQAVALASDGLDLRVVHLVRDPRGVANSLAKSDVQRPHVEGRTDLMSHSSPAESAVRWTLTQREIGLLGRLGVPLAHLQYEDFVRSPRESVLSTLFELDIPVTSSQLGHINLNRLTLTSSHGLSGNPLRFREGEIALRADEQWRTQMSRGDRLLVSALTLPARAPHRDRGIDTPQVSAAAAKSVEAGGDATATAWPMVSALVATRGRPQLVRETVQAVVEQTYPGQIECLVIHDQEQPDASLELLGRPDRPVTVIASRSEGLAAARNTGLDVASGEIIATCDDDDTWHPRKLELQVQRLLDQPDLLVVGSGIRLRLPEGKVAEWFGRADRIDPKLLLRSRVKELHSSTLVMRRDAFAKAGQYDEELPFGYAEDYDWVLRAARVGRIGVVRTPLADIRKDVQSYYTGQSERTVVALEHFLAKHNEIEASRRGHARILGQMAFHQSAVGRRGEALRTIARALWRWPFSPHTYLALAQVLTGAHPDSIRRAVRRLGRGMA